MGGAAIAMAERDADGLVRVTGALFPARADAWEYVIAAVDYPGVINPVVLVGASLSTDPEIEDLPMAPELQGPTATRKALSLFRAWLGAGRVVVDSQAPDLSGQLLEARLVVNASGLTLAHRHSRVDLAKACAWAVAEAAQPDSGPVG